MKIVTIGTVSSGRELEHLYRSATDERVLEAMEFLASVVSIERNGFEKERKRWRQAGLDAAVKIYVANPSPNGGETTVWAAIDVGGDGRTVTLWKIVDSYGGGNHESDALLADALHRKQHGQVS